MKRVALIVLLVIASCLSAFAIDCDSLTFKKKKKVRFHFAFNNKSTFTPKRTSGSRGFVIGLVINKRHRFGFGLNGLSKTIFTTGENPDIMPGEIYTIANEYSYFSFFYEYTYWQSKKLEISAPVHFGFGTITEFYREQGQEDVLSINTRDVRTFEVMNIGMYHFCRYFSAGLGIGFRAVLNDDPIARSSFNSPMYVIKIKPQISEMIRALKVKRWEKKCNKKYNELD